MIQQQFHKGMFNRHRSNSMPSDTASNNSNKPVQNNETNEPKSPTLRTQETGPDKSDIEMQEEPFTEVHYGKRQRSSPDAEIRYQTKQTKTYWLSAPSIPTSNRFKELDIETSETPAQKPARPPPLFIDGVSNIQPLLKMLAEVTQDQYEIKVLRDNRVKIQPKSADSYSIIYKELKGKNTEFYTYQPKTDRSFRVVLKNLHPSTDKEEIKIALNEMDHKVTNIWNIQNRKTKQALPMWNIELEPKDNNKDIYNVKSLLHCRIIFEAPRPNKNIPQCTKCQEYGHTQRFCHRHPRCVKCAGAHHTAECPRKERSNQVKCVLCDGNHPANYKGCTVYKELQKIKYPTPYPKSKRVIEYTRTRQETKHDTTNQEKSYSAATKGIDHRINPTLDVHSDKQRIDNELKTIRETLVALMNQMLIMTKTITELMSKMPIHSLH